MDILEYLEEASVYEVLEHEDKRHVLVHAGIFDFVEGKDLDKYFFTGFIFHRADYCIGLRMCIWWETSSVLCGDRRNCICRMIMMSAGR